MSQTPAISAILCSYNRAELLRRALESLCLQSLTADQFEVILIDDGSSDHSPQVAADFESRLPLRYYQQANSGLAASKNRGIELASAPIVVFLDDDDELDPACLEQHLRSHQQQPEPHYAVLGHTDLTQQVAAAPLMHYVTGDAGLLFHYRPLQHGQQLDFMHFWGGRSSCKRAFVLEHGLFNPVFRFGAEDIELGYRLHAHGLKVVYNRHAISRMFRTLDFDGFCRRSYLQGRSNRVFAGLHPDPVVRTYCAVDAADAAWPQLAPRYQAILTSGRQLDRYAKLRASAALPIDGLSTRLLHHGYHSAFQASLYKGSRDAADDSESRD